MGIQYNIGEYKFGNWNIYCDKISAFSQGLKIILIEILDTLKKRQQLHKRSHRNNGKINGGINIILDY